MEKAFSHFASSKLGATGPEIFTNEDNSQPSASQILAQMTGTADWTFSESLTEPGKFSLKLQFEQQFLMGAFTDKTINLASGDEIFAFTCFTDQLLEPETTCHASHLHYDSG